MSTNTRGVRTSGRTILVLIGVFAWTAKVTLETASAQTTFTTTKPLHVLAELVSDDSESGYGGIYRAVFSPDAGLIATRDRDQVVRVYDCPGGKLRFEVRDHDAQVNVAFSNDSSQLVTAALDEPTRIWNTATGEPMHQIAQSAKLLTFTPAGHLVLVDDQEVRSYDPRSGQELPLAGPSLPQGTEPFALTSGGDRVVFYRASRNGRNRTHGIYTFDIRTGKRQHIADLQNRPGAIVVSPDDQSLGMTCRRCQDLFMCELVEDAQPRTLVGHTDAVEGVAFSSDGRFVASSSWDSTIRIWERLTMKTVLTLRGHTQHVTAVDFGRSRFLVSGSSGDKGDAAKLWDFRAVLFDPATASSAGIGVPQTADAFWRRLGSEDPAQVYAVMAMMAANSDAALPLIDEILRSITNALTPEQVAELIEELNHDAYDTREAAYQRLLRRRASIREQLAAALDENVPLEVQTRLEWILATKADVSLLTDEARRRLVRLVHLLETIGNTAARDYLDLLAAGHADEEIVAAAQAALHRLGQPELSEFVRQAQPNQ